MPREASWSMTTTAIHPHRSRRGLEIAPSLSSGRLRALLQAPSSHATTHLPSNVQPDLSASSISIGQCTILGSPSLASSNQNRYFRQGMKIRIPLESKLRLEFERIQIGGLRLWVCWNPSGRRGLYWGCFGPRPLVVGKRKVWSLREIERGRY